MKIAIQGHPDRGKEVIQILESLGGRNTFNYNGDYIRTAYFIGMDYSIYGFCTDSPKVGFKVYTLEEFETQFPFKIGDEVIFPVINGWASGKITGIKDFEYEVNTIGGYRYVEPHKLSLYPMKEERNITLTLDKAKEWYKKGGELKEISLQAFTENELNPLPKSWEEFCEKYPVKNGECWVGAQDIIYSATFPQDRKYKTWIPSRRSAKSHLAMIQLEQLRNCWWNGWEPEWNNCEKYVIKWDNDDLIVFTARNIRAFLVFPTREMAYEFLKCFRNLIEQAGDLI